MKRQCTVQTRDVPLRVHISVISYKPPSVLVGNNVPDFVPIPENNLLFNPLDMLNGFITRLAMNTVAISPWL